MSAADTYELLKKIRYDLTAAQAKLTDAMNNISQLDIGDDSVRCPNCNTRFRGALSLAEHLHLSHDGPLPAHWEQAERLAGIEKGASA